MNLTKKAAPQKETATVMIDDRKDMIFLTVLKKISYD
jgi:hypothetical protein